VIRRAVALLAAAAVLAAALGAAADARPRRHALRGHVRKGKRLGIRGAARKPAPAPASGGLPSQQPSARAPTPTPAPGTTAPPPAPPLPGGSGRSLQARSGDDDPDQLQLVLSVATVLAGDVRIEFNNSFAQDPHDLAVERADGTGARYSFGELDPGQVTTRTLALDAGRWRLFCTIPTHAERGMRATLTVR
jgi:hypothetical protein